MPKITELPQITTLAATDLLAVVTDVATTPTTKKVAFSDLNVTTLTAAATDATTKANAAQTAAQTAAATDATTKANAVRTFVTSKTPTTGNTAIMIGDSIGALQWVNGLSLTSGSRFRMIQRAGYTCISGQTSTQMLARFATDVVAYTPSWAILGAISPNDQPQGITVATTVANVKAMAAQCVAADIRPIIVMGAPSNVTATNIHVRTASATLREWADRKGYVVWDLYGALVDPTTGGYLAAMTADGTHPTVLGLQAITAYNLGRIPAEMRANPALVVATAHPTNLIPNPLFIDDTNADGLADTLTKYGPGVATRTAVTAGMGFGFWQNIGADTGAQGTQIETYATTILGNVYELSFRIKIAAAAVVRFRCSGDDFTGDYRDMLGVITEASGAIVTTRFVATGNPQQILIGARGATGSVSVAQLSCFDLTAAGVA